MNGQSTISARLAFNDIDAGMVAALREGKAFLLAEMPAVLDGFYDHVARFPETGGMFGSRQHMMHAKEMQVRHWSIIAEARFDESYEASVTKIGETHNKLGLEPRWYIGGYNYLISNMIEAILLRYKGKPEAKARLQKAFVRAALLDMDFAIAVYLAAGRRERNDMLNRLAEEFEQGVGKVYQTLTGSAGDLKSTAETLAATAEQTSNQSTVVAAAAEQASANVQTVAAATEELSASVREIGGEAARSATVASEAQQKAEESSVQVRQLSEAARKIGDVVELISKIAKQTNLLALNATIEAARAGDAGKGFAVVAHEVKTLAEQTAKATSEISGQIKAVQDSTESAVSSIGSIGDVIRSMNQIATVIAAAVEEQGNATREIAQSVSEAATGTRSVSENILGVTQGTSETGSASHRLLQSSNGLGTQAEDLRVAVESFLHTLREAASERQAAPGYRRAA